MKNFVCALLCAVGMIGSSALAQMTTVTANVLKIGSSTISTGTVCAIAVDANNNPINVTVGSGGGMWGVGPSCAIVSAGAITTAVGGGTYALPDQVLAGNSGFYYDFVITDTSTGNPTSKLSFSVPRVTGVNGATWALDHYIPAITVPTNPAFTFTAGIGAPVTACITPSFYEDNTVPSAPVVYSCGTDRVYHSVAGTGTGTAGQGFTYRGAWAATTAYHPYDVVTINGQTYESSSTFTSGSSFSAGSWNLWAAQGATGATGSTGPAGSTGATGATGTAGSAGAAATVAVGTVTTLSAGSSATVTNAGTSSAAVLNFGLPQGAAGSGGGLTSNTVGNLTPLFTAALGGAPLTSPALAFTPSAAAQNAVLAGPATGGSGSYSFRALVLSDIPSLSSLYDASGAASAAQAAAITSATATAANAANLTSGTVAAARMPAYTGDATATAGTAALTLATVNSNTGSCGDATHVCQVTLDGKGRATAAAPIAITGSGGLADPGSNGLLKRTALNTTAPATAADVQAALASDTVDNTALTFGTGSGGDSTCPTPATGKDNLCIKGGAVNYAHNGGTYSPLVGPSAYATLTDGATVTWATGGAASANAVLTLVHTTSARTLNVTGLVSGESGTLVLKEDSTGVAGTFTLGTGCTWYVGGSSGFTTASTLTLTSTANAINIAAFTYDGTNCYVNLR